MEQIKKNNFHKEMLHIALPITFQSLFQASLSVIDQIMVGQLGRVSIAGVGIGGKFSSLFTVTVSAVATAAGILISQYNGKKDKKGIHDSFISNFYIAILITCIFTLSSIVASKQIMGLYSKDSQTIQEAANYLVFIAIGFVPMTITLMFSTLLRSVGYAKYPMYASVASVFLNTGLNYVMIFGKLGCPKMGLMGAALATTIARLIEMVYILILFLKIKKRKGFSISLRVNLTEDFKKKLLLIIGPLLACEFIWSLGENIYATIYGRMGTDECAAMTLTYPIQTLLIGAFTGLSAAAGIMVGKRLGRDSYDEAYETAKVITRYGFMGTAVLGVILAWGAKYYVHLFNVSDDIRLSTIYILYAFAIIMSVKVQNMILAGGVLRSGGNTMYTLIMDLIGTWGVGIPLGMIAAYVMKLPIYSVYFILSMEECLRLMIARFIFRRKKWMKNVT